MGEIKSVKVDNWGVFFLQKLQNFFNKTDYCDLTLQFNDNSQLKVHRLVLSACTDYFNVLEQTCEMMDDVLIMPLELQADVVVPIVNFMYTGTLEFELRMYGRLLKTARDMNMTVLLKLLEAHRRTMERSPTVQTLNRNNQRTSNYQRRTQTTTTRRGGHSNTTSYKSIQIKPIQSYFQASTTTQNITKYTTSTKPVKGPSRFDYPPEGKVLPPETFEQSFDTISYESKPLICKEEPDSEDYDGMVQKSSTFEELRRGYNNNKRPASSVSSFESPPEKKPNINDVKEFAEQQRVRKQIAQEFDDDNEFEETLDDEFHHDDDDDEYVPPSSYQKQSKQQQNKKSASNKEQQQQSVVIKQENNRQTIFVKDTQNSNVNHAKIISEVLRKYPHLVKNNKNIKLKIVPKSSGTGKSETQKIVLKTEVEQRPMAVPQLPPPSAKHNTYSSATHTQRTTGNIAAGKSLLQTKLPPKSSVTIKKVDVPTSATPSSSQQPRRIDSKTMHSLIAMGAENRTGPWLCLRCGVNGRPISIPSYRGFRRHLINAHQEKIDPRLCEHCGWRSTNNRELFHHMLVEHKIKPPTTYSFPKCDLCDTILLNYSDLEKHVAENHEEGVEVNQSCIYCNKTFANESLLYAHMKSKHRNRAKQDGVVDFSEDDEIAFESDSQLSQYHSDTGSDNKIKILSDISLPKNIPIIQAEDNAPGTTITLPTNIIQTDSKLIDPLEGPKFVNADGKEMELTDEQRQEIISQLQNQDHGAVVMVLNDDAEQLTSVLSGGDVSTSSPSTSVQATNVATPVAEKEQHKPRKTKHTVKTEIDDVGEGEEMIEWLDEESGNIMKVPLSKFSKMGDMEEEDEEGEEEMETEEETEEANKEVEAFENADDEEKSTKSKDINSSDKIKKEINDDDDHNHKLVSADENTSDSVKDKKEDEKRKDSTSDHEIEEKDESTKSQQKSKTKSKIAENSAMETLKILTGDWSDDDDGEEEEEEEEEEDESIDKDNLKDVNNEISKDEEILFETLEERETNGESSDKLSKEDDNKIKSKDNEKKNIDKKKERKDSDMDLDNMSTDEQEDILKMNDIKVEDVTDDDMKIIEELKNYEQEQLEAAEAQAEAEAKAEVQAETAVEAEIETTAADETKDKSDIIAGGKELRSKAKSISKSASPTMSESSNSGSSNISATNTSGSDKPKRRGRPKKTPIIKEQKLDSQDKDDNDDGNDKVKEDDKKIETTEKKAEESKDDKRNKDKQIENDEDKDDENSKVSRKLSADEENSRSYVKSDDHEENKKSDDKDETDTDANATETTSQEPKNASDSVNKDNNDDLITKAEIRNLISDWGDDDDDDDDDDL